ncbi:hypothetical protein FIBSPDRAFT_861126, partial [Athelia psychrophila]
LSHKPSHPPSSGCISDRVSGYFVQVVALHGLEFPKLLSRTICDQLIMACSLP